MLVKAEFVQELGEDTVDFLFLFNLSEDDLSLMGIDGVRHWDKKHIRHKISPNLTGELHDAVLDIHRRGFVIKLPFKPDTYENMEPFPGQLRKLRVGDPYWVMLKGPWKRTETHPNKIGKQRLSHPVFEAAGIYPYIKDPQGFFDFAEQLDELPQSFYQETEMASLEDKFREIFSGPQSERTSIEWWFRMWGMVVNPCLTREFLKTGEQRYGKNANEIDLKSYYRLFANTTEERKSPLRPIGSPLFNLIAELSNPEEFGALGILLPFAMILNPYAFVGPCSSPGLTSSGGSNATLKLLPFWIVDLFARTGYGLNYRYKDRGASIIYEAMRHLEQRNYQAFTTYNSAKPNWSETFNFDKDGLAPNGSTIFSRTVIQGAVLRRNKELEFARKGALKKVYLADGHYPNPYKALAGFLGKALDMVNINDALGDGIQKVSKGSIKIDTEDKQQAYQWRGLRHRVNTIEDLSNLILDQSLNFDTNRMLRVTPPITEPSADPTVKYCTPSQGAGSRMVIRWPFSCVTGNPGTGKAQPLNSKVLTPTGWKLMGDIQVGDRVISRNGNPVPVEAVYPQGEQDIYRVVFSDGSSTECTKDHLWLTAARDKRQKIQNSNRKEHIFEVRTLEEIQNTLVDKYGTHNHRIPMVDPVNLGVPGNTRLPLDPYLLGILLGDGCFRQTGLTYSTIDREIVEQIREVLPPKHLTYLQWGSEADYQIAGHKNQNLVTDELRRFGLWGKLAPDKFVPEEYLFTATENRIAILQGLMDSDGYGKGTDLEFGSTSEQLAKAVQFLVQSLGGTANISVHTNRTYVYKGERRAALDAHRVWISIPPEIAPFRLSRKLNTYTPRSKYLPHRIIRSVEYIGRKPAQCIRVDGEQLYITDNFIVTHNSYFLHELVRFVHEISQTGADTYLLLLTPTNAASSRICELFPDEEIYMFGSQREEDPDEEDPDDEQEESPRRSFRVAVGTIDSFLGKIKTSLKLREELRQRQGVLAIDEASMVTAEKFKEVLDFFRDADTNALSDRLLRGVLVGDPYQLLSVEPGNFYADMLKFLPTTQLTEQMRYGRDPEDDFKISLEDLFGSVRAGMTNETERVEVVQKLVDIAHTPSLSGGHIGVYLIDDIPTSQPPLENNERWWAKFMHDLEGQVRDIVLSEVLDWNHSPMSGGSLTPRIPLRPSREEQRLAANNYQKFHNAFTQTDLPFKIISCVRKPRSESGQTEYISSSVRVNGWIHDSLRGRTVQDLGFKGYCPRNGAPMIPIGTENIWYPKFGDEWIPYDTAMKQCQDKRSNLRQFLSQYRPNNLILSPGWPYVVLKPHFKKYGVFRGDTLRFVGATPRRNRNYYRFVTTNGAERELVVSARYCTTQYLNYGWASNVHQVQGSEYPLVIVLWLDGICYPFLNQNWQHVATRSADEITTPLKSFRFGGVTMGSELASLDDRLDSRSFYTAITRTSIQKLEENHRMVAGFNGNTSTKIGRCVIVAGKHALRRYLSLKVHDRCSPLYGMVWDKLQMAEKEALNATT